MTNRIEEINDLLSIFHDFEIVGLNLKNSVLTMEILLPWREMWNIKNHKMTFLFYECNKLKCSYSKHGTNQVETTPDEIVKLELDIQSHEFKPENDFILHCDSSIVGYAEIEINASDYKIYDNKNNEISLEKMKAWATEWWNEIQKMWDEEQ